MSRALPIADAFCAQEAEAAGEPLAGTAAHALAWVLVEESGAWERDPLDSPGLAEERATIEGWLATIPKSRLQLIRRPRASTGGRRVFLAMPLQGRLLTWQTASLASVPLVAAARGETEADLVGHPLHLVCTHGRRDRCCAQRGMPIFRALESRPDVEVWQTSHLGGHRFAATSLRLPDGYAFGYLRLEDVDALLAPELALERARGRVCYDEPTQAADLALRLTLGERRVHAVSHLDTSRDTAGWRVRFALEGLTRTLIVRKEHRPGIRPKSCGDVSSAIEPLAATLVDESSVPSLLP